MKNLNLFGTIFFALLIYLFLPLILILFLLPILTLRVVLNLLKPLLRSDLGEMVSPLSNHFAIDKLYEAPVATLLLGSVFNGESEVNGVTVKKEFVCEILKAKWLEKLDSSSSSGQFLYPELRHSIANWWGFTFWEAEKNFKIEKHIRIMEAPQLTLLDKGSLKRLFVDLVNQPFEKGRSPWELVIVTDENDSNRCEVRKTMILFKIHHALIDGFSMLNLGQQIFQKNEIGAGGDTRVVSKSLSPKKFGLFTKIFAIAWIPYFVAKFLTTASANHNPSSPDPHAMRQVSSFSYNKLELQWLKRIKTKHGVSLTCLLLAGFTAGIRNAITKKNQQPTIGGLPCVIPVPLPNHPEKLRNHMSFITVILPIDEGSPRKRLIGIHDSLSRTAKSIDILAMFYLLRIIGLCPSFIIRRFSIGTPVPFLLTNFPGVSSPLVVDQIQNENRCRFQCKDLFFGGGLLESRLQAICSCIGYDGYIHMAFSLSEEFMQGYSSLDPNDQFMEAVMKEFDELDKMEELKESG